MNTTLSFCGLRWAVAALLLVTLFVTSAPAAFAQAPTDTDVAIAALLVSIDAIGQEIRSSSTISEEDRLTLLTQLIQLSQAVMVLQEVALQQRISEYTNTQEGTSGNSALGNDNVYRFVAVLDQEDNDAEVTTYYTRDTPRTYRSESQVVAYTTSSDSLSFAEQVAAIEDQISRVIADSAGYDAAEVKGYLFMSARNPLRSEPFRQNGLAASTMGLDFGDRSLIESVTFLPGVDKGTIRVASDQYEYVTFDISKDSDTAYSVTASLFINGPGDHRSETRNDELRPMLIDSQTNLNKREVIDFIEGSFSNLPFAKQLDGLEDAFISFMTENETQYLFGKGGTPTQEQLIACVDPADKLILDEFVVSLLQGMKAQFINVPELVKYVVTLRYDSDRSSRERHCLNEQSFF